LTGHCLVAIGNERSGLFANDEDVAKKLHDSAVEVGEQLWRLPLGEEYSEALKSDVADLRNIGGVGRPSYGGASTAAAFLQNFVGERSWAHIDLASAYYERGGSKPWIRAGANGFGVQTMIEFLRGE
jgi:leucyl aminopeptidase